jgi:hypothetical protein
MREVSNTIVIILLILGIIISFGGVVLNLNRLSQIPAITGFGAGSVNFTVTTYKAIAVTGNIDFGSGYVTQGMVGAWLDSGDASTANGTWTWSAQKIIIENQGNSAGVVYVNASQDPGTWIGTGGQAFLNGTEPGSDNGCSGNTVGDMSSGENALNSTATITICSSLASGDSADTVDSHARIYIPLDISAGGLQYTNVTYFIQ